METVGRRFSWASLPLIATVARLLHKDLVLQVEYLRVQYDIVRSKVPGRIQFTDDAYGPKTHPRLEPCIRWGFHCFAWSNTSQDPNIRTQSEDMDTFW